MQRTHLLRRATPPTAVLLICLMEGGGGDLLGLTSWRWRRSWSSPWSRHRSHRAVL